MAAPRSTVDKPCERRLDGKLLALARCAALELDRTGAKAARADDDLPGQADQVHRRELGAGTLLGVVVENGAAGRREPGVRADAIKAIECFIHPREMPIVCEPRASKLVPQTDYDAKFSLPYTVACMLVRGHVDLDDFTPEVIRDAAVLDLAARVECIPDPDADYPRFFPGRLRMTLRDGRVLERDEPINRGSPERPLSDDDVAAKFRRNAAAVLPDEQVEALRAAVSGIDAAPSVRELAARLRVDS